MDGSQGSKVTVEYHDPSGVFPLISEHIASRLPLRNLNWKSPTRPLRSIGALHVEFVPDAGTAASYQTSDLQRVESTASGAGDTTKDSAAGGVRDATKDSAAGGPGDATKRRHQIPGLLQTPYLRLYILRCDDKDVYKATDRQLLRDWIRDNTPATQTSSQPNNTESHDACEWLILHVVIPDTVAASEPRWTAVSKKDPDELVERPQTTAKWPGKSTRTVLDKIRADFNTSTKSAPDRVAQLRLQKKHLPARFLPQTPVPSLYTETPQEQDNAWQDLVAKFKTLILMSFDRRVSQYENDLREKDAQRSLPGWNFCTFFTLKEGLARGFENVGLVEDALAIYDELSAGLDTAIRETSQSTFLGNMSAYSDALILASSSTAKITNNQIEHLLTQPLDLTKKDYRGEIVKNTISLFDFHLYIFARQRTLLLRLAAGLSPTTNTRSQSSLAAAKDDNLAYYAEVCRRAAIFAATDSRALRMALQAVSANEATSSSAFSRLVDDVVLSWTYAVLDQILADTAASDKLSAPNGGTDGSSALPHSSGPGSRKDGGALSLPQGANIHPTRRTSLQRASSGSSMRPPSQVIYENEHFAKATAQPPSTVSTQAGTGLMTLAAGRAELIMMQRKILEVVVTKRKGWSTGGASLAHSNTFANVNLDGVDDEEINAQSVDATAADDEVGSPSSSLLSPALSSPLTSLEDFRTVYEKLTNLALSHSRIAEHHKFSDVIASDLAVLRYQMGDYAQAASLFQRSSQSYLQGNWTYVHAEMLRAYAGCLKELHRKDEYMRVMLSLLSKVISRQRQRSLSMLKYTVSDSSSTWHDDEAVDVSGILAELSQYSQELPYNFTVPVADFFGDVRVSPEIVHYDNEDGFGLDLQLRHLLNDHLKLDRVRLRLVHSRDPSQDIWLEARDAIDLKRGLIELRLHSETTTYGVYLIDKLVLDTQKLRFIHDFQPKPKATPLSITSATNIEQEPASTGPSVLVFPNDLAFDARATLIDNLHVDKLRSIVVHVDTGRNDVKTLDLRLRGASAGLRLHTADAVVIDGSLDLDTSHVGAVRTNAIGPNTKLRISLPYSLEHGLAEVLVKLEAHYTTSAGSFVFVVSCNITVELPLDVDVHDIFKTDALFSLFSIRTTKSIPLQLTNVNLQESAAYSIQALPCPPIMTVFEKQPASLTYKISKRDSQDGSIIIDKKAAALAMTVQYISISDEILNTITSVFQSALSTSPHARLARLLTPHLRNGVQCHDLALQFERAVLLRELRLPAYETIVWDTALRNLAPATRTTVQDWLRAWHKQNTRIAFDPTAGHRREITISVEVPTIDVVHTASLILPTSVSSGGLQTTGFVTAMLGVPLKAELHIEHTRKWASLTSAARQGELYFVYTVRDAGETWLIGGQRRARFSFSCPSASPPDDAATVTGGDQETKTFALLLIPMKTGTHALPTIDIVPIPAPELPSGQRHSASLWTSVTRDSGGVSGEDHESPRPDSSSSVASPGGTGLGVGRSVSPAFGAGSITGAGGPAANGTGGAQGVGGAGSGASRQELPTCETVLVSSGTVVRVVKDTRTTSVNIGGGGGPLSGDVSLGSAAGGGVGAGSRMVKGRSGSADTRISGFVGS